MRRIGRVRRARHFIATVGLAWIRAELTLTRWVFRSTGHKWTHRAGVGVVIGRFYAFDTNHENRPCGEVTVQLDELPCALVDLTLMTFPQAVRWGWGGLSAFRAAPKASLVPELIDLLRGDDLML